jgi:murein DD-endopeptidase MepM/ murein hydrolase activator NlpD
VRRVASTLAAAAALVILAASNAWATDPSPSPSPCPTPSVTSGARTGCQAAPATDPNAAAYALLESRLGGDLARALSAEQQLSGTLDQLATTEQALTDQVAQEEAVIADLEDKIALLDAQIADTEARIDVEKQQLAALVRDIYRQPSSFWILIARTGSLSDALVATSDAVIAGQRAHALQVKLEADLAKLQAERSARQADLDRENATHDLLVANLSALDDMISTQSDVSDQLSSLISDIQDAQSQLTNQPPDVTATLAQLLESQEQDLILRSYQTAWTQAQVGAGQAVANNEMPLGKPIAGLQLSWPMNSFTITQPFGPTNVLLEPPFGPYRHFHTGIDLAAALGAPVMAAADGLVVAVGHTASGYGNFVVIAHGSGIETLYGHLLSTSVNVGDVVKRGQVIGLEGSTGFSTGPHLHFELRVQNQVIDPMPYLPVPGTSWAG